MCGSWAFSLRRGRDVYDEVTRGLFQMQHRGQDAWRDRDRGRHAGPAPRDLGYVREVFGERPAPDFRGHLACGHVRYPTQGGNRRVNAQPAPDRAAGGPVLALGSNGDLTNYWAIRRRLEGEGVAFAGTNDAELLLNSSTDGTCTTACRWSMQFGGCRRTSRGLQRLPHDARYAVWRSATRGRCGRSASAAAKGAGSSPARRTRSTSIGSI